MAFNHDNFRATQNYQDLDASLDWYITAIQSKIKTLEALARHDPSVARNLYQNDTVMKKIYKIVDGLDRFKSIARTHHDET